MKKKIISAALAAALLLGSLSGCAGGLVNNVNDGTVNTNLEQTQFNIMGGISALSSGYENNEVLTAGVGPITAGSIAYQEDVVYWLSHIINAEAGNQPLDGKIAVGNVVLNRVANPRFPSTVYEVIFQRGQFTPVSNGSIHLTPNEQSIVAAKLCLDGANTVGNALYFINPRYSPNSWASRNRPYVATIGAHAFYA